MKQLNSRHLIELRQFVTSKCDNKTGKDFYPAWDLTLWYRPCLALLATSRLLNISMSINDKLNILLTELKRWACSSPPVLKLYSHETLLGRPLILSWTKDENTSPLKDRYFGPLTDASTFYLVFCNQYNGIKISPDVGGVIIRKRRLINFLCYTTVAIKVTMIALLKAKIPPLVAFSKDYLDGEILAKQFKNWLVTQDPPQYVLMAYEQQPWQCLFIEVIKQKFPDVPTIGYIHSSMPNFPSQYIKHASCPDHLIVHGSSYRRILVNYLGWRSASIHESKSFRYQDRMQLSSSMIFLPYSFESSDFIVESIRLLMAFDKTIYRPFMVKIHPALADNSHHQSLRSKILKIFDSYRDRFSENGKIVVVTVGISTTLMESLEAGYESLAIIANPELDALNPDIWPNVTREQLSTHFFRYNLKIKGSFIDYPDGSHPSDIVKYLKDINFI